MSKLDDILNDMGSTLFCKGQDWKSGDGSASEVDTVVDAAKQQIKDLIEALVNETFDKDDADAYRFWQKIKAL